MTFPFEYSEKEIALFEALGEMKMARDPALSPPLLYKQLVINCFMREEKGPLADSVRRCYDAICNVEKRLTDDFDSLIELPDEAPCSE